jgi:outer membrane protein TolC
MRFDERFCARTAVTAGLFTAAVSVFGLSPVHAQTKPATPPAAQQGQIRRLSIDDAVATALEQNLDLQVQRINPQLRDADIAFYKTNYAPTFTTSFNLVDQTQPPSSLLSGNTSQLTNGRSTFDFGSRSRRRGTAARTNSSSTTAEPPRTTFSPASTRS